MAPSTRDLVVLILCVFVACLVDGCAASPLEDDTDDGEMWEPEMDLDDDNEDPNKGDRLDVDPLSWPQNLVNCVNEAVVSIYTQSPNYPVSCCKFKALSEPCQQTQERRGPDGAPLWPPMQRH